MPLNTRYGLEIRAATAADGPGLAELLASALPRAVLAPTAQSLVARIEAMRDGAGAVLVAVAWGPPSGVVAVHWYRTVFADGPAARIDTLFVAEDERRRGIGRLLVKAASRAARSAGCDTMTVTSETDSLDAFCRQTGFSEAGRSFARSLRKTARA